MQNAGKIVVTGIEGPEGPEAKLPVAVAGGAPPAVVKLDRSMVGSFASSGTIQPIDDLIPRDQLDMRNYSAATSHEFYSLDKYMYKFVELMNYSRFRPVIPAGKELWEQYNDRLMQLIREDSMPVETMLEETARQGQIKLDEGWARAKL